jgi:hypothetical protein
MKTYWISWYSGGYEDEGCVDEPPFQYWWSGQAERPNYGLTDEQHAAYLLLEEEDDADNFLDTHSRSDGTACAMVEAESVDEIWQVVGKYFPDYRERFCNERAHGVAVGDRFANFENKISLY